MNLLHRVDTLMMYRVMVGLLIASSLWAQTSEGPRKLELSGAEYRVHNWEERIRIANGKPLRIGSGGNEAMRRVKALMKAYPDHPKVLELYTRVKSCVKRARGNVVEITPEMTAYRDAEKEITRTLGALADREWEGLCQEWKSQGRLVDKPFPTLDPGNHANYSKLLVKHIVLTSFEYPQCEFTNAGRQYVYVGSRAKGMYFVDLSDRNWLSVYEALRRYRRLVNSDLPQQWTLVGTTVGTAMLVPRSGQPQPSDVAVLGWVLKPEAIYIPGQVLTRAAGLKGVFSGDTDLIRLNQERWTVKSVPEGPDPLEFVKAYQLCAKEKNCDLWLRLLDPSWTETRLSRELAQRRWDTVQKRFLKYMVHVEPVRTSDIIIVQGEKFGGEEDLESFFLEEDEKEDIEKRADDLIEEIKVWCQCYGERGKQVGTPIPFVMRRYKGGRWFAYTGISL